MRYGSFDSAKKGKVEANLVKGQVELRPEDESPLRT